MVANFVIASRLGTSQFLCTLFITGGKKILMKIAVN
jgi:hypothetical protein